MERIILRYEGNDLTVKYERPRCIHAERCVKDLPEVFNPKRKPWVDADATSAENLANLIHTCPSGALHYERTDGGTVEPAPKQNTITLGVDGPLWIHGNLEINGIEGETREFRAALCRCGASKYKPFCDGSHEKLPFSDDGKGKTGKLEDNLAEGELRINPLADGPLQLSGPMEIRNANGEIVFRGEKTALCRCGASGNKPFCDGSHMGIGFTTD